MVLPSPLSFWQDHYTSDTKGFIFFLPPPQQAHSEALGIQTQEISEQVLQSFIYLWLQVMQLYTRFSMMAPLGAMSQLVKVGEKLLP